MAGECSGPGRVNGESGRSGVGGVNGEGVDGLNVEQGK